MYYYLILSYQEMNDAQKAKHLEKVRKYLRSERMFKGPAPDNGKYTSAVWSSGVWNMIFDAKHNNALVNNTYICTVCDAMEYVELSAKGNSRLTRHACYRSHVQKQLNAELLAAKEEKKSKKVQIDSDSGSDNDDKVSRDKNALTYEQWSLLSRTFYKFRNICIETSLYDADGINPSTFYTIMPKKWNYDEW